MFLLPIAVPHEGWFGTRHPRVIGPAPADCATQTTFSTGDDPLACTIPTAPLNRQ